jgi:flagella basal body P-ring formation protein FlgA
MLEELRRHHRADRVAAQVLGAGVAAAVSIEAGHRIGAAQLELVTQDVFGHN